MRPCPEHTLGYAGTIDINLAVELHGGGIGKVKRRARFNHTACVYLNIRWK